MADYIEVFGNMPSTYDMRDYKIKAFNSIALPDTYCVDMIPVKNQFTQGTCTAFSSSEIVEYHHKKQTNEYVPYSTEFIYGMRFEEGDNDKEGLAIRRALQTLLKYGDPTAQDCPGNNRAFIAMSNVKKDYNNLLTLAAPTKISGYARVEGINAIKTAIMTYGPVIVSLNWYNKYSIDSGILKFDHSTRSSRHAVVLYGWNEHGWLMQNSWGITFGNLGRVVVPFSEKPNEAWCIYDDFIEGIVHKSSNSLLNKTISSIINWLINLFTSLIQ